MTSTRSRCCRQLLALLLVLSHTTAPAWGFSVSDLEVISLEAGKPFEARLRLTFEDYENPRTQIDARLLTDYDYPPDVTPLPFLPRITVRIADGYVVLKTPAALGADDLNAGRPKPSGFGLPLELRRSRDGLHLIHLYRLTIDDTAMPVESDMAEAVRPPPPEMEPAEATTPAPMPGERRIGPTQPQDNLYNIARRLGYRNGPDTWAAVFALWRHNVHHQAFVDDNAFGLREGVLLTVPADLDAQVADSLPAVVGAMREQHALDWQARTGPVSPDVTETDLEPTTARVPPERTAMPPAIVPQAAPAHVLPQVSQSAQLPVSRAATHRRHSEPAAEAQTETETGTPVPATLADALKPLDAYLKARFPETEYWLHPSPDPAGDANHSSAMLLFSTTGLTVLWLATIRICRRTPKRERPRR